VNALRKIHAALVPGGLVIETQPVSAGPAIEAQAGELGRLDMHEWAKTIDAVDERIAQAIRYGLFVVDDERRFIVTDAYDDGAEFVSEVREWAGTHVDDALAERARHEQGPVRLHQEVRLRVLRRP
jgi:hypothetical protein